MTLYRQLVIAVVLLFLLMFAGTLIVNVQSTRAFLATQLESHAQDTATSLGLSLSPHMEAADIATMIAMVDAVFDRGYYQQIEVETNAGEPLIVRNLQVKIEGVPTWFVRNLELKPPRATALLMAGWVQAGKVMVRSHPGIAYRELWQAFNHMLWWFAAGALAAILIGAFILRVLLRPLHAVERQAEALCARRYEIQEKLPRTRELRSVVTAMNRMTAKIREMFDEQSRGAQQLRKLAYQDPVTTLGNRRYFNLQLGNWLKSVHALQKGALLLVQLRDLTEVNDKRGFAAGDELLKAAARIIKDASARYASSVPARIGGGDFVLLVPDAGADDADELAAGLCASLARLTEQRLTDSADVGHVGVAMYVTGNDAAALLSQADLALRAAQSKGPNGWHRHQHQTGSGPAAIQGRQQWQAHIRDVIRLGDVVLFEQPVSDTRHALKILHNEVLVRIPDRDKVLVTAGIFMPMAEQLQIAHQLDRIVLTDLIRHVKTRAGDARFAVNLSPAALRDQKFQDWVVEALREHPETARRLSFEFAEYWVARELERVRTFTARLRETGAAFGIDHFGRGFSPFGYLQSLRPDYVKIDGAYTAAIADDQDNQFFVRTLCGVAHSLDVLAIAEAVESEAQAAVLRELNVDGLQGYVVSRPRPLKDADVPGT